MRDTAFSPATFFPLAAKDPAAACCYCWARGGVYANGLDVLAWFPRFEGVQRFALKLDISATNSKKKKGNKEIQGCYKKKKKF